MSLWNSHVRPRGGKITWWWIENYFPKGCNFSSLPVSRFPTRHGIRQSKIAQSVIWQAGFGLRGINHSKVRFVVRALPGWTVRVGKLERRNPQIRQRPSTLFPKANEVWSFIWFPLFFSKSPFLQKHYYEDVWAKCRNFRGMSFCIVNRFRNARRELCLILRFCNLMSVKPSLGFVCWVSFQFSSTCIFDGKNRDSKQHGGGGSNPPSGKGCSRQGLTTPIPWFPWLGKMTIPTKWPFLSFSDASRLWRCYTVF